MTLAAALDSSIGVRTISIQGASADGTAIGFSILSRTVERRASEEK